MEVINYIVGLGATVMMPIIITIFGLCLGAKFSKAVRSGLTVGIGFLGLNLVIGLLCGALGPASQKMVERLGLHLTVIDVGWPAAAAIAFGSTIGALIIPLGLVVNFLLLLTKQTKTIDVDIWDYWHFAFTGALVTAATGSIVWGGFAAVVNMIIVFYLADWTAPAVEEYNKLPGVSLPHGFSAAYVPIAMLINKLIGMIPGIRDIEADPETLQEKFGIFGEPMIIGTVLGFIIGGLAGYDLKNILVTGITMGGCLVLIPRMASMLMEGLIPISDAAQELIQSRFKHVGKIYIGLDSAVAIGHPACMAAALMLVPTTIILAAVLPGNRVLPFADLAVLPFMLAMVIPVTKGNVFRTFIVGLVMVTVGLLIATDMASLHTQLAINANFKIPEGATQIASICDGANPLTWAILKLTNLQITGSAILIAIIGAMAFINNKINKKRDMQEKNIIL